MLPVQRICPVATLVPIMPTRMPKHAATTPLSGALPDSAETIDTPKIVSASISGVPIDSTNGRTSGREIARISAPMRPPSKDDV